MRRHRTRKKRSNPLIQRNPIFGIILAVLCGVFYCAGLSASDEVKTTVTDEKKELLPAQETNALETDTEKKKDTGNYYDPTGKTDPFKSFIAEQEAIEEKKRRKPKTYLETLDLSQMDLIAIIISPKGNWAMVRDAKGLGYVIKKGTPIGINEGVVQEIREKEVIVRERYRDYRGREKTKDVAKKLLSQ